MDYQRLAWLLFALVLSSVHSAFSVEAMTPDPFPFMDFPVINGHQVTIAYQTYVHMVIEFVITIIITGVLASVVDKFKLSVWTFFALSCADLVDYLLCYNSVWGHIGDIDISMNTTKVFIFSLVIFYEWLRKLL